MMEFFGLLLLKIFERGLNKSTVSDEHLKQLGILAESDNIRYYDAKKSDSKYLNL